MEIEDILKNTDRLFFSIKEVSEITGLSPSGLRFWEKEFSDLCPQRSGGGHRRYQKEDIGLILKIKDLLYAKKFTIKGAREELKKRVKKSHLNLEGIKKELEDILGVLK